MVPAPLDRPRPGYHDSQGLSLIAMLPKNELCMIKYLVHSKLGESLFSRVRPLDWRLSNGIHSSKFIL